MNHYESVRDYYSDKLGDPVREASFAKGKFRVDILKWDPSPVTDGVNIYATLGASDHSIPGGDLLHRQEFFVGLAPERDDIAEPLARLGGYSSFTGRRLDSGHIIRLSENLVDDSEMSGFLVVAPLGDFLPAASMADGRHVEFLMAIPVYPEELDFAARNGVEDLREVMASRNIPFWRLERGSTFR
ncbi:suppressor of fused domain protein [Streptosporangium sp. NPDC049376]|uniref:suppressor of fused domain protein n=1 Tax=Streptosporangium sp. NPDC049376 TaxID=3366192 RepID=UPI0037A053C6